MKKNDFIYVISVLIYSFLFYKQMPGLNFFLITIILLLGQIMLKQDIIKNRNWILSAAGALCSAFCVFHFGNLLSIFATFFSLLLASYFAFLKNGSVLIGIVSSISSILVSVAFMISDFVKRRTAKQENASGNNHWKKIVIVLIALVVVTVFFLMYRESSLMFYNLTQKINFDWISWPWLGFTFVGAIVFYGFYFHNSFVGIVEWENNIPMNINPEKKKTWLDKMWSMDSEQFSGIVLFSLLNLLLLVVNVLDANFIFFGSGKLPQGVSCMEYVHQGVGMLITSIVVAMLIILYYFRGRMNFASTGKYLRVLALIWIFQNAFMLYSTFWRNEVYSFAFGLTYKRIGVFVYLLLTLIGLCVTAWKVYGKKTNAFLIRTNSWLFYSVWVIACFFNWDKIIFENNISISQKPDVEYLNSLSMDILPQLYDYSKKHPNGFDGTSENVALPVRIFVFLQREKFIEQENKWQSTILIQKNNYDYLKDQINFVNGSSLSLPHAELKHIYFFKGFEKITSLDVSDNDLVDIGEIANYKNLTSLDLRYNHDLVSLKGMENLNQLTEIDLAGTNIDDFSPLMKMKNLTSLTIDQMSDEWQNKLKAANPNLGITIHSYDEWP